MNSHNALVCECGNTKRHKRAVGCEQCLAIEAQRLAKDSVRERVLSYLSRVDETSAVDMMDALEIPHLICRERDRYSGAIARLVKDGLVEMVRGKFGRRYRLVKQRRAA